MKPSIRKSFVQAAVALGLIGAPALFGAALLAPGAAYAQAAPTLAEMKQTLAGYGEFVSHEKYGEVWKPTVTPRGWHPYPACDWVYTKDYGWYFNDKTPWGAIVHHYGRWTHDARDGWLWVPGTEFSPGWVVWRTSPEWVGWAPTMPDVDLTAANMAAFDDDKLWTFMDVKKFGSTCDGVAAASQAPALIERTTYVTDMRFYGGIGVFVLPARIVGPVVNINIGIFAPWSTTFIGSWVWNWTSIFNDVDIDITVVKDCKPGETPNGPNTPRTTPISTPPAPPPNVSPQPRRTPDAGPSRPQRVVAPGRPARIDTFEPAPDDEIVRRPRRPQGQQARPPRPIPIDIHDDRGPREPRPNGRRPGRELDPGFWRGPGRQDGEGGRRWRRPDREAGQDMPRIGRLGGDRPAALDRLRAPRGDVKAYQPRGEGGGARTYEPYIR